MYSTVLLPIDLNEESSWRRALPVAVHCCRAFGATLCVATVLPDLKMPLVAGHFPPDFEPRARAALEAQLAEFVRRHVPAEVEVTQRVAGGGTVYERILEIAERSGADLIVMAAYRPDAKTFLLGPNAARVVRHAGQSVLVVRD